MMYFVVCLKSKSEVFSLKAYSVYTQVSFFVHLGNGNFLMFESEYENTNFPLLVTDPSKKNV